MAQSIGHVSGSGIRRCAVAATLAAILVVPTCSTRTTWDGFLVSVSGPVGLAVDQVALWVLADVDGVRQVVPRDPDRFAPFRFDTQGRDLAGDPFLARLVPGEVFRGSARVIVVGFVGDRAVARAEASGNLDQKVRLELALVAIAEGCDGDGDGFPDCARAGCCPAGGGVLSDCDDAEPRATPVGFEDACSRCGFGATLQGDAVDDDCDGTPATCLDADGDGVIDCVPAWCDAESKGSPSCLEAQAAADCDPARADTHPGAAERCDGRDNNCDGSTDETIFLVDWDGTTRRLVGESCGTGACAGGIVECDTAAGTPRCSTDGQKAAKEDCATSADDNCNGVANDPARDGCGTGDADGDGVPDDVERELCPMNPLAAVHSEVFPEVEEGPVHPFPEPCCPAAADATQKGLCDWNCDGVTTSCAVDDADGDGYPASADCNDEDPAVHPDAPEKCGDGIDQDCKGGDLPCSTIVDADSDGYAASGGDCDDGDAAIHPGAAERCNGLDDDCDGYVDEGNPEGADAECGSAVGECSKGISTCTHREGQAARVECWGDVRPVDETCNDKDDNCDDSTDEGYTFLDWNGAAASKGATCGTGVCQSGQVVCKADGTGLECSTATLAGAESCNNQDDNCDGATDEGFPFHDFDGASRAKGDGCGTGACKSGSVVCRADKTGLECSTTKLAKAESCNDQDDNCDGATDEGFPFHDWDGASRAKGDGCGTGACADGTVACKADKTGLECSTSDLATAETCNKADDDCDGVVDNGTNPLCADALTCTQDSCSAGECVHPLIAGRCLIGGTCRADQDVQPTNPCRRCISQESTSEWSAGPDDVSCDDGKACSLVDTCSGGVCVGGSPKSCAAPNPACREPGGTCGCGFTGDLVCDVQYADACKVSEPGPTFACTCGAEPSCNPATQKCCPAATDPARCCPKDGDCSKPNCGA